MEKISHDIIVRPILTEKTMGRMPEKVYVFRVRKDANKITVRNSIEEIFKVKVDKVNMLNVRGKFRRHGRHSGYTPSWKKAYVKLTSDSKAIGFFEGMC